MGDFVVGYVESQRSVAQVLGAYAEGATEIDRFFAATVKEVHGVDITQPPEGPSPETVAEWGPYGDPATPRAGLLRAADPRGRGSRPSLGQGNVRPRGHDHLAAGLGTEPRGGHHQLNPARLGRRCLSGGRRPLRREPHVRCLDRAVRRAVQGGTRHAVPALHRLQPAGSRGHRDLRLARLAHPHLIHAHTLDTIPTPLSDHEWRSSASTSHNDERPRTAWPVEFTNPPALRRSISTIRIQPTPRSGASLARRSSLTPCSGQGRNPEQDDTGRAECGWTSPRDPLPSSQRNFLSSAVGFAWSWLAPLRCLCPGRGAPAHAVLPWVPLGGFGFCGRPFAVAPIRSWSVTGFSQPHRLALGRYCDREVARPGRGSGRCRPWAG
jgi:hypothetical protein